jgi:hypothetical protein
MALTTVNPALLDTQAQYTGFKNRIINGAMVIDQRNAGASVTPTASVYTLDRWQANLSVTSKYSVQRNAGSVTPPAGFTNYLGITSLSAYSVGAGENFAIAQSIEGFNVADLGWGTANAATVTLSFWVRSSLTGTFGGSLINASANRAYPFSYTISAANTWEYKTVTVAGDTSGTWGTGNGTGIGLYFGLGVGSTFSGTAGAWSGSLAFSATGATSVVGTNGATFYITGVQLEKGSTATSFDYRPYGTELALCQRYFEKSYNADVTPGTATNTGAVYRTLDTGPLAFACPGPIVFRVTKRATPSVVVFGPNSGASGTINLAGTDRAALVVFVGENFAGTYVNNFSAGGSGSSCSVHYTASAEL